MLTRLHSKGRLSERFHWVPTKFINEAFKEHSHFYGAFFAIDAADRKRDDSIGSPFQKLKSKRSSNVKSEQVMISLEAEGYDFEGLREEIRTAEARWRKEEGKRSFALQFSSLIPSRRLPLPYYSCIFHLDHELHFRSVAYDVPVKDHMLILRLNR